MPTEPFSLRVSSSVKRDILRIARQFGTTAAALGSDYLVEGVRTTKHPSIEFRRTPVGRMAYIRGVRLPVWLAVETIENCKGNFQRAASLLKIPPLMLSAAAVYAREYSEDIAADKEAGSRPLEDISASVPNHSFFRA